jgi:hypothetical protein
MLHIIAFISLLFLVALYIQQGFAFRRLAKQYKELADKYQKLAEMVYDQQHSGWKH